MTDSIKRLRRLHALRSMLANAAVVDCERVAQQVSAADAALRDLEQIKASALARSAQDAPSSWCERLAALHVVTHQQASWVERRHEWIEAKDSAMVRQRKAVQEREQVWRILDRRQAEFAEEQSRREQARLDDLFATARVRSAKATAF